MINQLSAPESLTVQLFGPVIVRCGECIQPKVRSKKGIWLLALLALRANKPVSRDWLAATLWPDSDIPRETLRRTLTDLRRALCACGPLLDAGTRSITLCIPEQNVDVHQFDALARNADLESLERAIALYRGPLLQECREVWIDSDRAQRAEAYVLALQSAARMLSEGGQSPENAVKYLRSAIEADPFRESLYRDLMRLLAASGEQAAAVQVYRSLRVRLHDETHTEPAAETVALYRSLQAPSRVRQSRALPLPDVLRCPSVEASPTNLPRPLTTLLGRTCELRQIAEDLAKSRLVTVSGMGGLGKTRLAVEAGFHLLERYPDGVWFVDLAALSDGAGVARALAAVTSVREESDRPLESSLCEAMRGRATLLIMDNCEHLLDAVARLVRTLVTECPFVHVLATSRQSLGLTGELVLRLEPLSAPLSVRAPESLPDPDDRCEQSPAISLFIERAAAVQPGFALTPQNYTAVSAICRRLDGIPLALELAAARVRSLSVEQIASRLDDRFRLLISGDRAAPPRQHTLKGLVDWSYDLLEPNARLLFARLSVFSGGCTLGASEEICADQDCDPDLDEPAERRARIAAADVLDLMTDLVEKSLVLVGPCTHGESRYRMLDTLWQYASDKLNASGETEELRRKHLQWCLRFAETAEAEMRGPNQAKWLNDVLADSDNFRLALQKAGPGLERMRLASALFGHWYLHGFYAEGRSWLALVLRECPDAPKPLLCKAMKAAGDLCWALGEMSEARRIHLENLEIQRSEQDRRGIALSHNSLGLVAFHQGDHVAAIDYYRTGLAILRELDDPVVTGVVLMNLALSMKDTGDYAQAEELLAEAEGLHRAARNCQGLGAVLHSRCLIAKRLGDYTRSRAFLEEAMEIERGLENPQGAAVLLHTLGEIAFFQDDYDLAERCYCTALRTFRRVGARRSVAAALFCLGEVFCKQRDFAQSRQYHLESLKIEVDLNNRAGIINSLRGIAALELVDGSLSRAVTLLGPLTAESARTMTALPPNEQADYDQLLMNLRDTLGEERFAEEWLAANALTIEQAAQIAQQE